VTKLVAIRILALAWRAGIDTSRLAASPHLRAQLRIFAATHFSPLLYFMDHSASAGAASPSLTHTYSPSLVFLSIVIAIFALRAPTAQEIEQEVEEGAPVGIEAEAAERAERLAA